MSGPFKMKGNPMQRNFGIGSPLTKNTKPTDAELEKMVNVNLPEVTVTDKADKISYTTPTTEELAKAKRRGGETSDGTTASMKTNETTGKSEMVSVVSNKKKADALKAAQAKVFAYNKANKGKPGYKRQTFAANISEDNKYIN
tara:strand:+ start:255 stop:683 length:429 start_codon:yes stop_codon:yes gene_type:complete